MNKYFLYARKSSEAEDRQVASVDSQVKELEESVIKKQNIKVIRPYLTESKSAKSPGRNKFNEMITRIDNKEVKGVVCWKLDRLARNPVDGGQIIWAVNELEFEIITPTKTYTKDDLLLMYVEFGMANQFINDLSKNVKRGLRAKAEKGWLPSGAKPGYMNDKYAEKGNKKLKVDPKRFPLIRKSWELMLTGLYTPPQILEKLNNEWGYRTPKHKKIGGKPMSRSMIYRVFSDPFYYGEFDFPQGSGNWYKGQHEPMITREEFDKVQAILGKRGKPRPKTREFNYTGLFECGECGAAITAEDKLQCICSECKYKFSYKNTGECPKCGISINKMRNPKLLEYVYYHCTKRVKPSCTQRSVSREEFEKQVDLYLSKIQISERFKNWAISYLSELGENEIEERNKIIESQDSAIKDAQTRIDNLVRLYTSPQNSNFELLSPEEFKNQKDPLMREKEKLIEKRQNTNHRADKWVELSEKTFNFACHARYWFANGSREQKREIFYGLGSNLRLFDKIVRIDVEKPLEYIKEAKKKEKTISPKFEPKKNGFTTALLENYWSQNPSMLERWYEFGRIDWVSELEYPEWTVKEVNRFLQL